MPHQKTPLRVVMSLALRLYLGAALCLLSALAIVLASSYLLGGAAPATILTAFVCIGCDGVPGLAALTAGAIAAAVALGLERRAPRQSLRAGWGAANSQC